MAQSKKALIAGASGLVGGALLDLLLQDDRYSEVHIIGRRKLNVAHEKIREHLIDFHRLEEQEELFDVDDVFCCLGTTIKKAGSQKKFKEVDYVFPFKMAELSQKKGVKHYVLISSMGADARSLVFYNKVKGQIEEGVKKLNIPSISIVRPSLLLGDRNEFRMGEKVAAFIMKIATPLMLGPAQKYRPIEAKTVAKAMLQLAQKQENGFEIHESDELQKLAVYP